jgi:glutamate synthase domain-containing protein 3
MIEEHFKLTGSGPARRILASWDEALPRFKKIMPRDYRRVLEEARRARAEGETELQGTHHG